VSAPARQLDAFGVSVTLDPEVVDATIVAMHRLPRPARERDRQALETLFVALHCSVTGTDMVPVTLIPTNLR
jgi:hypothetical protein